MALFRATTRLLKPSLEKNVASTVSFYHKNVSYLKICNITSSDSSNKAKLVMKAERISSKFYSKYSFFFQVIDHYENPRNVGSMDKKDKNVGTGLVGAPACGDVMKLQVGIIWNN